MFGRTKRREAITQREQADAFTALRQAALDADPADLGLELHPGSGVYGVVMDIGMPAGTVTVVGLADGTTSMYTASGGGIIGGGAHEPVRAATRAWLRLAATLGDDLQPAVAFGRPGVGEVAFVVLSVHGHRVGTGNETRMRAGKTPLASLYAGGQAVITQLRLTESPAA